MRGVSLPSPIDLTRRPYNTAVVTRPCDPPNIVLRSSLLFVWRHRICWNDKCNYQSFINLFLIYYDVLRCWTSAHFVWSECKKRCKFGVACHSFILCQFEEISVVALLLPLHTSCGEFRIWQTLRRQRRKAMILWMLQLQEDHVTSWHCQWRQTTTMTSQPRLDQSVASDWLLKVTRSNSTDSGQLTNWRLWWN